MMTSTTHHHAVARVAVLLICVLIYLLASSAEVLVVKEIYGVAHATIPLYCAWLINTYVVVQLPIYMLYRVAHWYEEHHRTEHHHDTQEDQGRHEALLPCTRAKCMETHAHGNGLPPPGPTATAGWLWLSPRRKQLAQYVSVGLFAAGIVFLRMFGLGHMSGSLYVMITNCSVVFNYLLIRCFIPSRRLNDWHHLALVLAVLGVFCISLSEHHIIQTSHVAIGVAAALGAAFLDSLISVTSEVVFADVHQQKQHHARQQGLIGVLEMSLANGILPLFLLPLLIPVTAEYDTWATVFHRVMKHERTLEIGMLSGALSLSKMIDRISKFQLIHLEGAFFFTVMDTFAKACTALLSIWLFGESLSRMFLLGIIILSSAGLINGYAAWVEHHHLQWTWKRSVRVRMKRARAYCPSNQDPDPDSENSSEGEGEESQFMTPRADPPRDYGSTQSTPPIAIPPSSSPHPLQHRTTTSVV